MDVGHIKIHILSFHTNSRRFHMNTDYLFLGDSITDSNHLWLPETNGLGDGYVAILADRLGPDARITNKGIDGFTVAALLERLQRGFLKAHPDVISLLIGINDIGVALNTGVTLEELHFAENYREVLQRLLNTGANRLCSGPFIFPHPQKYQIWIPYVLELEQIMEEICSSLSVPFIPLHSYLTSLVKNGDYDAVTVDGIHLTTYGHEMLAEYLLPHLLF